MKKLFLVFLIFFLECEVGAPNEFKVGFNWADGNTDVKTVTIKNKFSIDRGDYEASLPFDYSYGWVRRQEVMNRGSVSIKVDRIFPQREIIGLNQDRDSVSILTNYWSTFVFARYEFDKMRNLDYRTTGGQGVKKTFSSAFSISVAPIYDYSRDNFKVRMSVRPKWTIFPGRPFSITGAFFYQPNIQNTKDYLITGYTSLKTKLSPNMGGAFDVSTNYESIPPVGKVSGDLFTSFSIFWVY